MPIIGRRAELDQAARAARRALTRGQTLVVTGDPGMGKSRFVEDLVRDAERAGLTAHGGAAQPSAAEPWGIWRTLWRDLLPWSPDEGPAAVRARLRAVEPSLEVRAPLLAGPLGAAIPPTRAVSSLGDEARTTATAEVLVRVLESACRRAPRALILEDAHWMDAASRELLFTLVTVVPRLPLLLVVVTRTEDRTLSRELPLRPGVSRVRLPPLTAAESRALVVEAWRTAGNEARAAGSPGDGVLQRLADRSGGNALFVLELVNLVRGATPSAWDEQHLPRSLTALVRSRIEALDEGERVTLGAASVLGPTFGLARLARCRPGLGDLRARLDHLAHLGITEVVDPVDHTWRFRHPLTREVVYRTLTDTARRDLHGRVAHELATSAEVDAIQVAWHFAQTGERDQQRRWFVRAARAAVRANDPRAALGWFERWLALDGADEADERAVVLDEIAGLAFRAGSYPRAQRCWLEAVRLADQTGAAEVGGAARVGLATLWGDTGRLAEAEQVAEEAVARFEAAGVDSHTRIAAMLVLAQLRRNREGEGAAELATAAFGLAQTLQEPWFSGRAAGVVARVVLRRPESVGAALPWITRARQLSEAAEDPVGLARALDLQGVAHWWTGRALEATAAWGRTLQELLRIGEVGQAWTAYGTLAQAHLNRRSVTTTRPMQALRCEHDTRTGRWRAAATGLASLLQTAYFHPDLWDDAANEAELYVTIATEAGTPSWRAIALASAALVWWRTGRDAGALAAARTCLSMPPDGLADEAKGWSACWGQLSGRRLGAWTPADDALVDAAGATAAPATRGFFAAALAIRGVEVDGSLSVLEQACVDPGDVFLHAIREVLWGRPMDPPPRLDPPPDLGEPPAWADLFAAVRERWSRRHEVHLPLEGVTRGFRDRGEGGPRAREPGR